MVKKSDKSRILLICLILALVTFAVYHRVRSFEFVSFDDFSYVSENPNVQAGIIPKAIEWAFTTSHSANWHPLTWLSHILDWQLFGSNAGGHHLTNLLFHIINTLLLFIILKQMTNAIWQSAFVAALFALHPLHVESVAWVAERKDVLSAFFWLLTMAAYLRYVKQPNISRYLLTLLIFALGLMAKPMLVTLPFVLLLLDYWPLNRINSFQWRVFYRLILEKIPFIIISAVSSVITFLVQRSSEAVVSLDAFPLKVRISNALISYLEYIEKMLWPCRLAVFYPHPGQNVSVLYAVMSAGFLLAVTIVILRLAQNHKYLATGWFWFLGTFVPIIGFVQVGAQAMADRYSYITLTGLFIIIAWGIPELLSKWPHRKIVLWPAALIVLSLLTVSTCIQLQYWKDSISLCQHAINVTGNNYMANNIGIALFKSGRIDEAIDCYNKALEINPSLITIYPNLGAALVAKGQFDQAISLYNKALKISPDSAVIHLNLGVALVDSGKFEEAAKEYQQVLRLEPKNFLAYNDLGIILSRQGRLDDAIAHFNQAIKINPNYSIARDNLNIALAEKQKLHNSSLKIKN